MRQSNGLPLRAEPAFELVGAHDALDRERHGFDLRQARRGRKTRFHRYTGFHRYDGLLGLISGPVAGRGFGMPFLASSLDEPVRNGPSSG